MRQCAQPTTEGDREAGQQDAREGRPHAAPGEVTPHTLRRTFASLALAAGRDPRWVMGQLGHTDARLTLNVYAQVMQRHRVDEALIWQLMRFPDEPEERHPGPANETRIETAGRIGASSRGRRDAPANKKTPS